MVYHLLPRIVSNRDPAPSYRIFSDDIRWCIYCYCWIDVFYGGAHAGLDAFCGDHRCELAEKIKITCNTRVCFYPRYCSYFCRTGNSCSERSRLRGTTLGCATPLQFTKRFHHPTGYLCRCRSGCSCSVRCAAFLIRLVFKSIYYTIGIDTINTYHFGAYQ